MLIVEDGSGLANAESYASVSFADTYLAARGMTLWATMSTTEKEQALRRATDYIEQAYRQSWAGYLVTTTQALMWPRYEVPIRGSLAYAYYPSNAVPLIVQNACAAMALKAASGELAADIGRLKSRVTVGPITTEYVAGSNGVIRYLAINMMLAPFFDAAASGFNMKVVRA